MAQKNLTVPEYYQSSVREFSGKYLDNRIMSRPCCLNIYFSVGRVIFSIARGAARLVPQHRWGWRKI